MTSLKLIKHDFHYGARFFVVILVLQLVFAWLLHSDDSEEASLALFLFYAPAIVFFIHLLGLFKTLMFGNLRYMVFSFPVSTSKLIATKLIAVSLKASSYLLVFAFAYEWALKRPFIIERPVLDFVSVSHVRLFLLNLFILVGLTFVLMNTLLFLTIFLTTLYKGPFKLFIGIVLLIVIFMGVIVLADTLSNVLYIENGFITAVIPFAIASIGLFLLSVKMLNEKLELS